MIVPSFVGLPCGGSFPSAFFAGPPFGVLPLVCVVPPGVVLPYGVILPYGVVLPNGMLLPLGVVAYPVAPLLHWAPPSLRFSLLTL